MAQMKHIRKTTMRNSQKSRKAKKPHKAVAEDSITRRYMMVLRLRKRLSEVQAWLHLH